MSFLPYCTVCDKQLSVPNNNVLYCSEKCRRKDARSNRKLGSSSAPNSAYTSASVSASPFSNPVLYPRQTHNSSDDLAAYGSSVPSASSSVPLTPSTPAFGSNHTDLSASYSSVSAMMISKGSRQRHPNSIYSSSPRSIDLVSPFQYTPPMADSIGNFTPRKRSSLTEPSYDMPLVTEKKTSLNGGAGSQPKEGSLKKLFYFSEVHN